MSLRDEIAHLLYRHRGLMDNDDAYETSFGATADAILAMPEMQWVRDELASWAGVGSPHAPVPPAVAEWVEWDQ